MVFDSQIIGQKTLQNNYKDRMHVNIGKMEPQGSEIIIMKSKVFQ